MDGNGERPRRVDRSRWAEVIADPASAFGQVRQDLAELREYAAYYVATRVDAAKAMARRLVFWLVLATVAATIALAGLAAAAVLLLQGLAGGLADLFNGAPWLGPLIVGAVVLLVSIVGLFVIHSRVEKSALKRKKTEYGERQAWQEQAFGHSVSDRGQSEH